MEMREFHNALRTMLEIDRDELVNAGIISRNDKREWYAWRESPFDWFIQARDNQALKIWTIMEERMT